MTDGFGAPYVKLFYHGKEIQDRVEGFKYKQSEEEDEACTIKIRYDDRNAPDRPECQEGSQWSVIWGYIGSNVTQARKIYLQDVKWTFDDQNILGTFAFTERAVSLKQRSTSKVYTNTNILDVLYQVAKVHGVKAYVEIPGQYTKPKQRPYKGSTKTNTDTINPIDQANKIKNEPRRILLTPNLIGQLNDRMTKIHNGGIVSSSSVSNPITGDLKDLIASFDFYGTIPQANRADKQLLDELVRRQKDGPYFIDTHDDKMILKRRHFDKPSHKTFNWADGIGDLLAFEPESKHRLKKGTSVGITTQGWDKQNKSFYSVNTNTLSESQQNTLSAAQQKLTELNKILDDPNKSSVGYISTKQASISHDATNVVKILPSIVYTLDQKKVAEDKINELLPPPTNNKVINDPTANNPTKGLNNGGNNRRDAELKNNPGYIEVIGDPSLKKGQIITILGVSKKYSGNYYIKEITHEIDGFRSYIVRADIMRQGVNIKPNSGYADTKESGKTINNTIGSSNGNISDQPIEAFDAYIIPRQSTISQDNTRVIKTFPLFRKQ